MTRWQRCGLRRDLPMFVIVLLTVALLALGVVL